MIYSEFVENTNNILGILNTRYSDEIEETYSSHTSSTVIGFNFATYYSAEQSFFILQTSNLSVNYENIHVNFLDVHR